MDQRIPPLLAEYDTSDSGWFKMKQFECWFSKTIIPCTRKSEAQKLALSDNLSPHFSEEVTGFSLSFECFPPNTTHAAFECRHLRATQEAVEGHFEQRAGV